MRLNELNTTEVVEKIKSITDYEGLRAKMMSVRHKYDWINVCNTLQNRYKAVLSPISLDSETIRNKHINSINKTIKK